MPILQLYGFIAVPDGPLMLFTALFLWSYKHFTERSNWLAVLFIAVSLAGLAYSKYHGALVLLFTVLSNLRLLKNPKFYAACLLAALLVIPHLWWQYAHDWVSLRYHLAGRNRDFEFGFVTEYLLNLFAIFNPFLFPVFIAAWWKNRAVRPVDRCTELHRGRFHPLFPLFYPARLRTAAMGGFRRHSGSSHCYSDLSGSGKSCGTTRCGSAGSHWHSWRSPASK